jgi:hypothetical protein
MEPLSANDPRMVGEFRLHARLGAGGMGQVYLGFSPAGRAVAIKVVHAQFARDPEFLERFSREVAAARAVSGMYTAPVVGSGLNDDPPWLATAYVPGPPLATVVARHGPLPEAAVWRLAAGLAEALRAVHAAGLVHRDLKPANVLLADDGPHVIDFGISRAFQGTQLTSAGMVIGTPGYMSPEQAESAVAGPPSDIFSLGCVLAYATTGNPPFGGGSSAAILYRVVTTEPDLSMVTPRLRQVIEACLKKDPAQRPEPAQLISVISAYGPATAATLGSFWPESVARVIAAEQASQTPAGLTPPGPVPAGFAGPASMAGPNSMAGQGSMAGTASMAGQAGTTGSGGMSGPPGLASPAPAEWTPTAVATPGPGQNAGHTGHAPMLLDGYYAAAAQPRMTPNPATPGPVIPPVSPVPQPYGTLPPTARAPGGPGPYGQAPAGPGTPSSYPGGPSSYPGGPSSWPQPPSGATPWLTGGAAGAPGGDVLAQYTLGRRNPVGGEIPRVVHNAIRLMYAGFAATCAALILSLMVLGRYTHAASVAKAAASFDTARGQTLAASVAAAAEHIQSQMAGAMVLAVIADVLGLASWAWLAVAGRRGRGWTRIAGTVLLGLYTLVMLLVLLGTHGDPGARFLTVVVWALGLATAILLWTQQAREFFYAWRKR